MNCSNSQMQYFLFFFYFCVYGLFRTVFIRYLPNREPYKLEKVMVNQILIPLRVVTLLEKQLSMGSNSETHRKKKKRYISNILWCIIRTPLFSIAENFQRFSFLGKSSTREFLSFFFFQLNQWKKKRVAHYWFLEQWVKRTKRGTTPINIEAFWTGWRCPCVSA